jgi:hypothetical protein
MGAVYLRISNKSTGNFALFKNNFRAPCEQLEFVGKWIIQEIGGRMDRSATEYLLTEATQAMCRMLPRDPEHAREVGARVAKLAGVRPPYRLHGIAALWASLAVCAAFGVATIRGATATTDPPHRTFHVELLETVVGPDNPLQVRFTSHRTRLCRADLERIVLDADGSPVHAIRRSGIGQAVTAEPITRTVRVPLPHGLPAGKYTYRYTIYSDCGGDIFADQGPDLPFEIRN